MNKFLRNALVQSLIIGVLATGVSYGIALAAGWITTFNPLEVFAVFTSFVCTYLCVKEKRINYLWGAISTAAYCVLFFQQGLIASAVLNAYLTPSLLYGWVRWGRDEQTKPVQHVALRWVPVYLGFTVVFGALAGYLIVLFGGALVPWDIAILVGTILAQFLLDNKKLETWIVWAFVNVAAIGVYASYGLPLASLQYVFFLGNAFYGYYVWYKSMRASAGTETRGVAPAYGFTPTGGIHLKGESE